MLEYLDDLLGQGYGPYVGRRLVVAWQALHPRYARGDTSGFLEWCEPSAGGID